MLFLDSISMAVPSIHTKIITTTKSTLLLQLYLFCLVFTVICKCSDSSTDVVGKDEREGRACRQVAAMQGLQMSLDLSDWWTLAEVHGQLQRRPFIGSSRDGVYFEVLTKHLNEAIPILGTLVWPLWASIRITEQTQPSSDHVHFIWYIVLVSYSRALKHSSKSDSCPVHWLYLPCVSRGFTIMLHNVWLNLKVAFYGFWRSSFVCDWEIVLLYPSSCLFERSG